MHIIRSREENQEIHKLRLSLYDTTGKLLEEFSEDFRVGKYTIVIEKNSISIRILSISSNMITLVIDNASQAKIDLDKVIIS
ncbi:MAG: hypothetical protein ACP5GI_02400 [Sulfolobales archaeon]